MSTVLPGMPTINRLSARDAEGRRPSTELERRAMSIPNWILGEYNLPRGSVFVADPDCHAPYLFSAQLDGGTYDRRAYMVVADAWATLWYPAFVRQQHAMVKADVLMQARDIFRDIMPPYWWSGVRETP